MPNTFDVIRLFWPTKFNSKRVCPCAEQHRANTGHILDDRFNTYVELRKYNGPVLRRCGRCIFAMTGFYPNKVRILKRSLDACELCGLIAVKRMRFSQLASKSQISEDKRRLLLEKTWFVSDSLRMKVICEECFKSFNRFEVNKNV